MSRSILDFSAVAAELADSEDLVELLQRGCGIALLFGQVGKLLLCGETDEVIGRGGHGLIERFDRTRCVVGLAQQPADAQVDRTGQSVGARQVATISLHGAGRVADLRQRLTHPEIYLGRHCLGRRLLLGQAQGDIGLGGLAILQVGLPQTPACFSRL